VSLRTQLGRFGAGALCAVALASCGGGTKTTKSGQGTTATTAAGPVLAQSVVLKPLSGTVRIKLPGTASFVRLERTQAVGLGTVIDVRAALVRLTAASPTAGKSATADFHEGEFEVLQDRAGNGVVELKIQNTRSERTTCSGANGSRQQSTRLLGLLLGSGTGQFQTRGDFAAASVSGTDWGVRNRCDGTLTVVRSGTIVVTDFRLRKNVTLHAGQTYLAKAA
jgi:hypothetical protein